MPMSEMQNWMTMPHVCIITSSAPATNPRMVKEVNTLLDKGYQVSAVVGAHQGWARSFESALRRGALKSCSVVEYGPGARTTERVAQLAGRWSARVWWNFARSSSYRVAVRANHDATTGLIEAASKIKADLYIAHYVAALPAAASAAARHAALYAFDAEDFHLGDLPDGPRHMHERRITQVIERRLLINCSYVTAASPGIADAYASAYGIKRPTVILNVFSKSQAPGFPTRTGCARPTPSVYWFSQTIGPDRGLECAVRAIAAARTRPHLFLRGAPAQGFAELLMALARKVGVGDRVHLLAPAPPTEMERLAAIHDVGLCGEPSHTSNNALALSNKLFSFILAGVPPLMSETSAQTMFAADAGFAEFLYPIDNVEALASLLDRMLGDPQHLASARAKVWSLGQRIYNWDNERSRLVACVDAALRTNYQIPASETALPHRAAHPVSSGL